MVVRLMDSRLNHNIKCVLFGRWFLDRLLDQRVSAVREEPNCVLSLCTPTLVNPLVDQRVSAVREESTSCRQPARRSFDAVKEIGQDGMWLQVDTKVITSDELHG